MKRRLECADCGKLLALYDDSDPDEVRGALTASNGHECKEQRAANRANQRARTYRIEVKTEGRWVPAPGEATGWIKADAERAIAAGIPTMDGSPNDWEDIRMVREEATRDDGRKDGQS